MRQAVIYPGDDGFWVAECPSLPGCVSQGETRLSCDYEHQGGHRRLRSCIGGRWSSGARGAFRSALAGGMSKLPQTSGPLL